MEEPTLLHDAQFWLPSQFLTDDDFLLEKDNQSLKGIGKHGGFNFSFPSDFGSPVDGSTETVSDEENFFAGFTRKMTHSNLEDDFSGGYGGRLTFPADNNAKGWSQSGSPKSTLCAAGISSCCRHRSSPNCQSRATSPAAAVAAWDLYCAAAEEMALIKINDEPCGFNHGGRGLLGPPRKASPIPVASNNSNIGTGYYSQPSLPYQKLQPVQLHQLKQQQQQQQQMMKFRQVMQNRGRVHGNNNNGRSVGFSPSAWPNLRHAQQSRDVSGVRSVFPGNRRSTGTGVFLPRRVTLSSPGTSETRKKQNPARVGQALDNSAAQPVMQSRFESQASLNDASMRYKNNNGGATWNELRLPSDWSY